jgi:lipopolysaccharide export system permease protein
MWRFARSGPVGHIAGFMRPRLIDRYLVSEVLWRLGAALALIMGALMLERLLELIDLLVNRGIPLRPVASMLLYLVPYYFGQALPAAFLMAALLAVARLRDEGAVDGMLSSGIGIHRLLPPLAALSAVLLVIAVAVTGWIEPDGRYAYHRTIYEVTHQLWLANAAPGTFFTGLDGKTITYQSADETGTALTGVFVYEGNPPGSGSDQEGVSVTTTAKSGRLVSDLVLRLYDGLQTRRRASNPVVSHVNFETMDIRLGLATDVAAFDVGGKSKSELKFGELWKRISGADGAQAAAEAAAAVNSRLARAAVFVFLPFLVLALGSFWRRAREVHGQLLAGVVFYIAYDHAMNFVDALVAPNGNAPAMAPWLVPAVFAVLSIWLFWPAAFSVAGNPLSATIENIAGTLRLRSETNQQVAAVRR